MKILAKPLIVLFALSFLSACSDVNPTEDPPEELVCAVGEVLVDGICSVVPPSCGEDEELVGEECLPRCGDDEERVDGECVLSCGEGEELVDGVCSPAQVSDFWLPQEVLETDETGKYLAKIHFDPKDKSFTINTYEMDGTRATLIKYTYDDGEDIFALDLEYHQFDWPNSAPLAPMAMSAKYAYDNRGNILTRKVHEKWPSFEQNSSEEYTYDDNANVITYEDDGFLVRVAYTYDDNGNMLAYEMGGRDGLPYYSTEFTYDNRGNELTSEHHDGDLHSPVTSATKRTYDNRGNILTYECYGGDLHSPVIGSTRYRYEYDENGNIRTYEFDNGRWGKYTYDDGGNLLTEELGWRAFNEDRFSEYKYTYTYDDHGNMLTYITHRNDELDPPITESGKYTYDDNGNMLTYKIYKKDGKKIYGTLQNYVPVKCPTYFFLSHTFPSYLYSFGKKTCPNYKAADPRVYLP